MGIEVVFIAALFYGYLVIYDTNLIQKFHITLDFPAKLSNNSYIAKYWTTIIYKIFWKFEKSWETQFLTIHNHEVAGSIPAPATKKIRELRSS